MMSIPLRILIGAVTTNGQVGLNVWRKPAWQDPCQKKAVLLIIQRVRASSAGLKTKWFIAVVGKTQQLTTSYRKSINIYTGTMKNVLKCHLAAWVRWTIERVWGWLLKSKKVSAPHLPLHWNLKFQVSLIIADIEKNCQINGRFYFVGKSYWKHLKGSEYNGLKIRPTAITVPLFAVSTYGEYPENGSVNRLWHARNFLSVNAVTVGTFNSWLTTLLFVLYLLIVLIFGFISPLLFKMLWHFNIFRVTTIWTINSFSIICYKHWLIGASTFFARFIIWYYFTHIINTFLIYIVIIIY